MFNSAQFRSFSIGDNCWECNRKVANIERKKSMFFINQLSESKNVCRHVKCASEILKTILSKSKRLLK
jgi:hypothetical protein